MKRVHRVRRVPSHLRVLLLCVIVLAVIVALTAILDYFAVVSSGQLAQVETSTTGTTGTTDTSSGGGTTSSGTTETTSGGGGTTDTSGSGGTDTSGTTGTTDTVGTSGTTESTGTTGTTGTTGSSGGSTSGTNPSAPSGLSAAPGSCGTGRIVLSWPTSIGAISYRLTRDGSVIYEGTIMTYTDQGLNPATTHQYGVSAVNSFGSSIYTYANATAPGLCVTDPYQTTSGTIPYAPSGLYVYGTPMTYVNLRWTDNANNEDKFNIERKLSTATQYTFLYQIMSSNATSYIDSRVSPGLTYDYRVQACLSGTGCSSYTTLMGVKVNGTTVSTTTAPTTIPVVPITTVAATTTATSTTYIPYTGGAGASNIPFAPTNLMLAASPGPNAIPLKWTDNSTNEDKWNIERKLSGAANFTFLYQLMGPNKYAYIDNTVTAGSVYDYRIQACLSGTGCSDYAYLYGVRAYPTAYTTLPTASSTYVASSTNLLIPKAPSNLVAGYTTTSGIYLKWSDNSSNEDKWNIERKLSGAAPYMFLKQIMVPNLTSYFDGTVAIGASYDYRVQACLSGTGCSDYAYVYGIKAGSSTLSVLTPYVPVLPVSSTTGSTTNLIKALEVNEIPVLPTVIPGENLYAPASTTISTSSLMVQKVAEVIEQIKIEEPEAKTLEEQAVAVPEKIVQDLFKDSNNDGISDFDSEHVYNLDPYKPSPVTYHDGKQITAGEKILLGYNPAEKDLVKIVPEEPAKAVAPVTPAYKVAEVALTEEKKVTLKGEALPNSFVTVYIYSTPIIVTVKTNSEGEWEYTLDKELDSGEHTVYTATVNNTGKIIAKSPAYTFTKTAEAATLNMVPEAGVSENTTPGLTYMQIYILLLIISLISVVVLFVIGKNMREGTHEGDQNQI